MTCDKLFTMALTNAERIARYKARKRGEVVPELKPGVKVGYKQTPEHIEKRKRWGKDHHAWKGDDVLPRSARARATRRVTADLCIECGSAEAEVHHIDHDVRNNDASNLIVLCHDCHMRRHRKPDTKRRVYSREWTRKKRARSNAGATVPGSRGAET